MKIMKIDRGVFEKEESQMTSICLTFDLRYDLNIQRIQSLGTGHAHVKISVIYYDKERG